MVVKIFVKRATDLYISIYLSALFISHTVVITSLPVLMITPYTADYLKSRLTQY